MTTRKIKQLPRVMRLTDVAKEILNVDPHEAYRLARDGEIAGAFKIGKHWFVNVVRMIDGMQLHP